MHPDVHENANENAYEEVDFLDRLLIQKEMDRMKKDVALISDFMKLVEKQPQLINVLRGTDSMRQ